MGHEGRRAVDDPPEVDPHDPLEVFVLDLGDVGGEGDAGVVEDEVHALVLVRGLLGPRVHRVAVCDVDGRRRDLHAGLAGGLGGALEALGVDVREGERCAALGEAKRERAADPGARAGDRRDLVREP